MRFSFVSILFSFVISPLLFAIFVLDFSKLPDHSIFIQKKIKLTETILSDGAFKNVALFKIIDNIKVLKSRIKTGEYIIKQGSSTFDFLKTLLDNKTVLRKITFKEGITVYQIIEELKNNPLLTGTIYNVPTEGSLFPSTYFYKFKDTRQSIINKMKTEMNKIKSMIPSYNKTSLNTEQIVILASIIEMEVNKSKLRPIVSSVYHNRLQKNMRLQSDPTIIYGLTIDGQYKGEKTKIKITKKDLYAQHPYNTYRKKGLPPTPICCPGLESIKAAAIPIASDYLFFVTDIKNNLTYFTKTHEDHVKIKKRILQMPN